MPVSVVGHLGRRRVASVLFAVVALLATFATQAHAARDIPIGVHNLNGARNQDGPNRIWAMRFVIDHDAKIDRLFTGFNMEGVYTDHQNQPAPAELRTKQVDKGYGSPPAPSNLPAGWTTGTGRIDYGHGNGGEVLARLVTMNADGTPNLNEVLAQDTFFPVERYKQTKAEFSIGDRAGMVYARFGGVALQASTPYWVVYQNVDPNPRMNFVSYNSPVIKDSESGPNGRNTLDPNATGAIMGLDPREVVAWTWDSGGSWTWGREVGGGGPFIPGDYVGSPSSDDGTRLPWYAWQETGATKLRSNQPYMSYPDSSGAYTVRFLNAPRATVLTNAGGYAPVGSSIGVVTVRNTRTGQTGKTASLGSGIKRGALDQAVTIQAGDTYEVSNNGTVWKEQGDNFLLSMGIVGPDAVSAQTIGQNNDQAQLFAGPHPYYESAANTTDDGGTSSPPPDTTPNPPSTSPSPKPHKKKVSAKVSVSRKRSARARSRTQSRCTPATRAATRKKASRWSRKHRRSATRKCGRLMLSKTSLHGFASLSVTAPPRAP
jgi:hypothetical protein